MHKQTHSGNCSISSTQLLQEDLYQVGFNFTLGLQISLVKWLRLQYVHKIMSLNLDREVQFTRSSYGPQLLLYKFISGFWFTRPRRLRFGSQGHAFLSGPQSLVHKYFFLWFLDMAWATQFVLWAMYLAESLLLCRDKVHWGGVEEYNKIFSNLLKCGLVLGAPGHCWIGVKLIS